MKRLAVAAVIIVGCVVASPAQQRGGRSQVTVPPLPALEDLAPPPGWKPDGHIPPRMPISLARLPRTTIAKAKYPAIDFHVHAPDLTTDAAYKEFVALLDRVGVGAIANMDGGTGAHLDAVLKAGEPYKDRVANFITFSADGINEPGWSQKFAAEMERAFKAGALGMKVWKTLGLTAKNADGTYIQADDPRLDPIWEMAAKYDKPVMIHLSDSIGRFYPIGPKNERYEAGLWAKPGDTEGNYYGSGFPTHETIEKARENMHRKHPKTRFVNAHMAMLYYDPAKVAKLLDTYPNADVEIAATRAGSRARAAAVARVHHQVPGPRAVRHRRRSGPRRRRLLDAALALPRNLRRVLRAPGPDPHRRRLAGAWPLEHLRHRPARRRAAQGLLPERAAPHPGAEGVDHAPDRRALNSPNHSGVVEELLRNG